MLPFVIRRCLAAVCLALAVATGAAVAQSPEGGKAPLPADLDPVAVDSLLSRMTDAEIRALLRDELRRRADERAAAEAAASDQPRIGMRDRLTGLAGTIGDRLSDWAGAIGRLGERRGEIDARLARAEHGPLAMLAATLAVGLAGVLAAAAVGRATRGWREWLMTAPAGSADRAGYWDRVVRTLALGLVELTPIGAFDLATVSTAPLLAGTLGPMVDYVWIYEVGVIYSWGFIVLTRRAFAPDAPALRIAQMSDSAATAISGLLRRAAQIGGAGWLVAGLSPTFGLGFPPALATVTLAGTAVAGLLLGAAVRNWGALRAAMAGLLTGAEAAPGLPARMLVAAAPLALAGYVVFAWAYWAALWITTGQQHLYGPAGTLLVLLSLPIFDRLGLELCSGMIRGASPAGERYRAVLHGTWRMLAGLAAVLVIAWLWGIDLYALAKGPGAPGWADAAFDIAITLLLANFVWRLIRAALHRDRHSAADGAEEGGETAAASRLDTLVPLFRNLLLVILSVVVAMILLAALGVNIGPLLASAGIVGIAIGFGAQTLVRDIFSGAFFLLDDAFRVGEYIELDNKVRGEVEAISIRSLQLRHHRGPVITIPFGELKSVFNHNRDWAIYKMNFRLEPETDPDLVKRLVKEVGQALLAHPEHGSKFLEPLKSQGIYMIDDDSALVIRVKFKCKPRAQFVLRREVYHRLRNAFAANGLEFARRKVEVVTETETPRGLSPAVAGAASLAGAIAGDPPGTSG